MYLQKKKKSVLKTFVKSFNSSCPLEISICIGIVEHNLLKKKIKNLLFNEKLKYSPEESSGFLMLTFWIFLFVIFFSRIRIMFGIVMYIVTHYSKELTQNIFFQTEGCF